MNLQVIEPVEKYNTEDLQNLKWYRQILSDYIEYVEELEFKKWGVVSLETSSFMHTIKSNHEDIIEDCIIFNEKKFR